MKHTLIFAALAAAVAATPAPAQPVAADLLPAYEAATIVASMGMRPVGRPAWMRGRYVVAAIDRYGRAVNVVLDARDGQVLAVQPLGRNRFGAPPPPGYGRPAPYDSMDGRALPPGPRPEAAPDGPSPEDEEFFDNDRQQGSLPPRAPARLAAPPRAPSTTGSVTRSAPPERKDAAPMPRPRPALARANDPGTPPAKPVAATDPVGTKPEAAKDAAKPDAGKDATQDAAKNAPKPEIAKPEAAKPDASKPGAKQASAPQSAKPAAQAKPEAANKPEAPKTDVRVIDLSKPKETAKPEAKPGEAIRF